MEKVKFNFLKKEKEVEMYGKIRKMLIKKGYKPLNNIRYKYCLDYKKTKYPYNITLTQYKQPTIQQNHYSIAA